MLLGNVELIVQRVGGAPAPTQAYLISSRVDITETAVLIMNAENREIATPTPTALVVVDLSAIDQTLDRLNLDVAYGIDIETAALVVTVLRIDHHSNRVA